MLKLPTKKSSIEKDLAKYAVFIYGREKIGKTSLAAQFPDALFLMFEPGGKSLEIYRADINSWLDFIEIFKQLQATDQFQTIIIDTIDLAFKYCSDYMCKKLAINHPSDEAYGKAYGLIRDEFSRWLSALGKLDRGVVYISHAVEKDIKKLKGDGYLISPTLSKQGREVLEPMVDIWGYYGYDNTDRFLQVKGDEEVNAGCRLTQNFVGVNKISMGKNPQQAYANFLAAFNKNKEGGEVAPRKLIIGRK
jgi:hypothetical protein